MTNKRKQRIRSIAKSTSTSHAEAANLLQKEGPRVKPWKGDVFDLFVHDHVPEGVMPLFEIGGFKRTVPDGPLYDKGSDQAVVISEAGDSIMTFKEGRFISVPMSTYIAQSAEIVREALRYRMWALLEALRVDGDETRLQRKDVVPFFRKHFANSLYGTVHIIEASPSFWAPDPMRAPVLGRTLREAVDRPTIVFGVFNYAGVRVTRWNPVTVLDGDVQMRHEFAGLVAFSSRVKGVRVI